MQATASAWNALPRIVVEESIEEDQPNPYYNPTRSRRILQTRDFYRDEMNSLIGDVSPYWNKDDNDGLGSDGDSESFQTQSHNPNHAYTDDEPEDEQQEWW